MEGTTQQRGRGRGGNQRGGRGGSARKATSQKESAPAPRRTRVEDGETFVPPISCNYLTASGPPPVRTAAKRKPEAAATATAAGQVKKEEGGQPPAKKAKLVASAPVHKKQTKNNNNNSRSAAAREGSAASGEEAPARKKVFIYGNYDRYYNYRNKGNAFNDDRLDCFKREWFEGKRVLDIGCNMGIVTKLIARRFSPKHILGVDVDEDLIKRAQQQLERDQRRKDKYEERKATRIKFGDDGKPEEQSSKEEALKKKKKKDEEKEEEQQMDVEKSEAKHAYPHNIAYQTENFVEDKGQHKGKYDVIMCLSVTKWIHLNWGDEGVKTLFTKIFDLLDDGGVLILEPQEWKSYMKKAKLTPAHKVNRRAVQLRPEQFRTYLIDQVGFKHCEVLRTREAKEKKQKKRDQTTETGQPPSSTTTTTTKTTTEVKGETEATKKPEKPDGFDRGIFLYRK